MKILQAVHRPLQNVTESSPKEGVGGAGEVLSGGQQQFGDGVQLALLQELPRFSEWVLDVRMVPVSFPPILPHT